MAETRKDYIIRIYGCNEKSVDHWDLQDQLHNGHIPGTATEREDVKQIVPRETISIKEEPKKTRGRPKNV